MKLLEKHIRADCNYKEVTCENNCGKMFLRYQSIEHESICDKRIVTCEHCDMKIVFRMLQKHYISCSRFLVRCPNNCANVPRIELNDHLRNCPESLLECPFKRFGCTFSGKREQMEIHREESQDRHLEAMGNVLVKISSAHEQQQNEVLLERNKLLKRVNELEDYIGKRESRVTIENNVNLLLEQSKHNDDAIKDINARSWNGCFI